MFRKFDSQKYQATANINQRVDLEKPGLVLIPFTGIQWIYSKKLYIF